MNMNSSVDGNFKVLVYSVGFYPDLKYEYELKKLNVAGPEEQRSCSSIEKNIFGYNLVLIPIQKCNNWTLAVSGRKFISFFKLLTLKNKAY